MADEFPQKPGATGHETRDINARAVAWFGLGLVITFLVIFLMARWLLGFLVRSIPWARLLHRSVDSECCRPSRDCNPILRATWHASARGRMGS